MNLLFYNNLYHMAYSQGVTYPLTAVKPKPIDFRCQSHWQTLNTNLHPHSTIQTLSLKPQPSTLNPQQSELNPQPSTLIPQHSTLKPQTSYLNPQP